MHIKKIVYNFGMYWRVSYLGAYQNYTTIIDSSWIDGFTILCPILSLIKSIHTDTFHFWFWETKTTNF